MYSTTTITRPQIRDNPRALDVTVPVKAGTHAVGATFLATNYRPSLDLVKHYARSRSKTTGSPAAVLPVIGYMRVEGPSLPNVRPSRAACARS